MIRHRAVYLAAAAGLLTISVVVWTGGRTIQQLLDPCIRWGVPEQISLSLPPDGGCRGLEVTTETKAHALTWLILGQGGMLAAAVLGMLGGLLTRPTLAVAGAAILFPVAFVAMSSIGWLILIVVGLFLVVARDLAPIQGAARYGLWVIGSLSGLMAIVYLFGVFRAPRVVVLSLIPALFVFLAAWLPVRPSRSTPSTGVPTAG